MNFLEKLSDETLTLKDFNQNYSSLIKCLTKDKIIGKGVLGIVYAIDNIVVKEIQCTDAKIEKYCNDVKNFKLFSIPYHCKKNYILPNILLEIIIGQIFNNLFYAKTLGSFISQDYIYIIQERYKPLICNDQLNLELTPVQFIFFLFQIAFAILTMQQKYKFTHGDLHLGNLLWDDYPKDKEYISFPLPNQNMKMMLLKQYCPFIIKIADFGVARMEDVVVLTPAISLINSQHEFMPYYDFAYLLGSILKSVAFKDLFKNTPAIYQFFIKFILWYYKDNKKGDKKYIVKNYYQPKNYRPIQCGEYVLYQNTQSMVNVVNFLAKQIILTKYVKVHQDTSDVIKLKDLHFYRQYDDIRIFDTLGKSVRIADGIIVYKTRILLSSPPAPFNFTISKEQIDTCPHQQQRLTIIKVNKKTSLTCQFNCCKLDAVNEMVLSNDIGFTVNGNFFNIKKDYLPIGPYKGDVTIDQYPIPEEFRDLYYFVNLDNNQLSISKTPGERYFVTGPVFIKDGKLAFDPYESRFMCAEEKFNKELMIDQDDKNITLSGYYQGCGRHFVPFTKTYRRCDKIEPGELQHLDNPNPRTVLCFTKTHYLFICFDGRGVYGDGVDLDLMARLILQLFPDVHTAINMDGGRSSIMAFATESEPHTVYHHSHFRNYYYPAGMLIQFKK